MEEAFYTTNRVMTFSLHKFKDYFPGTGHIDDIGLDEGKYNSINFPLNQVNLHKIKGMDDDSFVYIF